MNCQNDNYKTYLKKTSPLQDVPKYNAFYNIGLSLLIHSPVYAESKNKYG